MAKGCCKSKKGKRFIPADDETEKKVCCDKVTEKVKSEEKKIA